MRKLKTKILNVLLVSAIGATALGGALLSNEKVTAGALSAPSGIFSATSSATVSADATDNTQTAFSFPDGGKISFRRDLALKWFEGEKDEKFLNLTFSFKDISFETLTFTFESATATASDEDKATNTVTFTSDGTKVTAKVNDGEAHDVNKDADVKLELSREDGKADGVYALKLSGVKIGEFVNVGGSFADYKNNSLTPFFIEAKLPENATDDAKTTLLFKDLNGQKFTLDAETGKIAADTAAPVLVLNEELTGFTLGAKFDVDYSKIDVLDDSLQATLQYYQYNPTHTAENWVKLPDDMAFSDTVYESTTVFDEENGTEFVSVRLKLEDDAHKGEEAAEYYFSWYADQTVSPVATANVDNKAVSELKYLPLTKNENGPVLSGTFDFNAYQTEVEKLADVKSAGTSAKLNLPSVEGMFEDDDTRYKGFKYTVYYKSKSSPNGTSTSASYNSLTLPVEKEGEYEFKIVATDKTGNAMTALDESNKTVEVTAENVWDLTKVRPFTFKIKSAELSVEESKLSVRSTTGIIDVEFEADDFDVKGPSGYGEDYALFYFDMGSFKAKYPEVQIDETVLAAVKYSELVAPAFNPAEVDDVADLYVKLYAERLVATGKLEGVTAAGLTEADSNGNAILRKIGEKNSSFSESVYPDNKYEWNASDKKFNPAEEGIYIVFGIFTHPEQASNTVGAYQVVSVSATEDIIAGETQWLRNNLASIILFSIAAVLLVVIIILLLVKPSDETLEDVTKAKKKEKSDK